MERIKKNIEEESPVKLFGIKVLELRQGYSLVEMKALKKDRLPFL